MRKISKKQEKWLLRSRILWRLSGMVISVYPDVLTPEEKDKIELINKLRREILDNAKNSSILLGFNAKNRCSLCGKAAIIERDAHFLCGKCNKEYE